MDGQKLRILAYIAEHGSITNLEATRLEQPIMNFQGRVSELRLVDHYNLPTIKERNETTGAFYNRYYFSENDRQKWEERKGHA